MPELQTTLESSEFAKLKFSEMVKKTELKLITCLSQHPFKRTLDVWEIKWKHIEWEYKESLPRFCSLKKKNKNQVFFGIKMILKRNCKISSKKKLCQNPLRTEKTCDVEYSQRPEDKSLY